MIRHGEAHWQSEGYGQLKFRTFKNPTWRTAAILKMDKRKRLYLGNELTDRREIWHSDTYFSREPCRQLKYKFLKIQDGGQPLF